MDIELYMNMNMDMDMDMDMDMEIKVKLLSLVFPIFKQTYLRAFKIIKKILENTIPPY